MVFFKNCRVPFQKRRKEGDDVTKIIFEEERETFFFKSMRNFEMKNNNRLQILAENLERIRKEKGYSRKIFANVLGITEWLKRRKTNSAFEKFLIGLATVKIPTPEGGGLKSLV